MSKSSALTGRTTRSQARIAVSQSTTNTPVKASSVSAHPQADQTEATNDPPPRPRKPRSPSSRPAIPQSTNPGRKGDALTDPPVASAASPTSTTLRNHGVGDITAPSSNSIPKDGEESSRHCDHLQHPVYAESVLPHLCPLCEMGKCINDMQKAEFMIKKHGSGREWQEHIHNNLTGEEKIKADRNYKFWTGSSKSNTLQQMGRRGQKNGTLLSHRRARTNLQNMMEDLEVQRDWERVWEESLQIRSSALRSQKEEDTRPRFPDTHSVLLDPNMGSATNALKQLQACIDDGTIGTREVLSAIHGRKRAREMHMADKPDFPGRQDYHSNRKAFKLTQEQHDFVATAGDDYPEYDPDLAPGKRKRRRTEKTDFDSYIYTRSERDVDLLFSRPIDQPESVPESILRTTPKHAPASPVPAFFPRNLNEHMNPPPKLPYTYTNLNIRENKNKRWTRRPAKARPGYELVNTSGWKKPSGQRMTFDEWDAYVDAIKLPDTYHRSPGEQLLDELEDQRRAEVQAAALSARAPSHGGMTSACAFGGFVASRVLQMARRYGWL